VFLADADWGNDHQRKGNNMAKTREVVLHLVQDVLEDVEVFANEQEALQHLSLVCNERFTSVEGFIDWREQHPGRQDEYCWVVLPEKAIRKLREVATV
jgi:hypothetical protein